jgi:hypothetical protein
VVVDGALQPDEDLLRGAGDRVGRRGDRSG